MSEHLDVNRTNELMVRGELPSDVQLPGGGSDGVQVKVHRTRCTCGWVSEWRAAREYARDEALTHQREGCSDGRP